LGAVEQGLRKIAAREAVFKERPVINGNRRYNRLRACAIRELQK